jgi:hypothetical protein
MACIYVKWLLAMISKHTQEEERRKKDERKTRSNNLKERKDFNVPDDDKWCHRPREKISNVGDDDKLRIFSKSSSSLIPTTNDECVPPPRPHQKKN